MASSENIIASQRDEMTQKKRVHEQEDEKISKMISSDRKRLRYADKEGSRLYSAIVSGDNELFQATYLQATRDEKDFKNSVGETLIHTAVKYNRRDIFDVLMSNFRLSIVNNQNYNGQTALHCAVFKNDLNAISRFKSANANFEIKDNDGKTPFALAVRLDRTDLFGRFLEKKLKEVLLVKF